MLAIALGLDRRRVFGGVRAVCGGRSTWCGAGGSIGAWRRLARQLWRRNPVGAGQADHAMISQAQNPSGVENLAGFLVHGVAGVVVYVASAGLAALSLVLGFGECAPATEMAGVCGQ